MNQQGTLTVRTAAELMNVHYKTVEELIKDGTLRAGKVGRAYVLLYSDVMAHIERVIIEQTNARQGIVPRRLRRTSPHPVREGTSAQI